MSLRQDLAVARRALSKRPACTAIAVLILALGIGANNAIFGAVERVLPHPPVSPIRLAFLLWNDNYRPGIHTDITPYPTYRGWRQAEVFSDLVATGPATPPSRSSPSRSWPPSSPWRGSMESWPSG